MEESCLHPGEAKSGPILTAVQQSIVRSLAAGKTIKEIGGDLAVTSGTMSAHLSRIRGRLKAKTNYQALLAAYKRGFIE